MTAAASAPLSTPDQESTLAAWKAREAELRPHVMEYDLPRPQQAGGRCGLELLQAMMRRELPAPPICRTLNFLLVEAEPGRVQFQGKPLFDHYNPLGTIHGGWIATLLDSAVACAVHSLLPPGKAYTTLELKVNYVKGLTDRVPLVRAIGEIIHLSSRIGTADGRLVGPDGTLFAHATTTCILIEPRA
jgi:uncharacterized protein (TIGR00369 family)